MRSSAIAHNGLKPHCYKNWIATPSLRLARNDNENKFAILNLVKTFLTLIKFIQGEKMKRFEKIFFVSLTVIISISCSGRSGELNSALKKHKNEYGVDNILTLIREKDLESALYESAIAGYSDIVSGLVKYGANIDYRGGDGDTLLMQFCKNGNIEAAKILIDNGADVSITDYNGNSILYNLKNYEDKRDLVSYMYRQLNVVGIDYLLDTSKSDLKFDSFFYYGSYDYVTSSTAHNFYDRIFYTDREIYINLVIKVLNKDLYVRNNTINVRMSIPKPNNSEYYISIYEGKLISNNENDINLIYDLEVKLYDDIDTQNKAIKNQFIFKVVANKPVKIPIVLEFPIPYKKNNTSSYIRFDEEVIKTYFIR